MELLRPRTIAEATAALRDGAVALAGGTEVVPLLRDGPLLAARLVPLAGVVPRGVDGRRATPEAEQSHEVGAAAATAAPRPVLRVGAGTTLAELEVDPEIPAALREACRLAASPQLRSMGTLGGNLLQATRCWYWRLHSGCWLQGGDRCHAREGEHREHAFFGNGRCASAHPSDPAAALLALGATLRTDRRELPLSELYRLPRDDDRSTTTLAADELLLELEVPSPDASVYLKAMDRKRFAFALVGVAAARSGGEVRIALAGAAPIPWLLAAPDALDEATPLPGTSYKVEVARTLVDRALEAVAP
ncbi:MAG: FAD binding domain-containing protein [Thermoleophilia bacterium]|nr:FAD binding domain-containing protein [Thermoleophilia bacterium]